MKCILPYFLVVTVPLLDSHEDWSMLDYNGIRLERSHCTPACIPNYIYLHVQHIVLPILYTYIISSG